MYDKAHITLISKHSPTLSQSNYLITITENKRLIPSRASQRPTCSAMVKRIWLAKYWYIYVTSKKKIEDYSSNADIMNEINIEKLNEL